MHPVEVEADAFLGDIAVHPVPPHSWPRTVGRILESRCERIFRSCARAHVSTDAKDTEANIVDMWRVIWCETMQ